MFRWVQLGAVVVLVGVALATITRRRGLNRGVLDSLAHKRIPLAKLRILLLVLTGYEVDSCEARVSQP